ncbi:MAG: DNA-binding response regulator, partial [Gemmatimonadetes bacterium]|nr:DNA-binding response regulator [Gemmatimonadota bacterium]
GREVELTPLEYGVVDCLFWNSPKPVGVDTLSDFVWGDRHTKRRSLVQVYVSYVRKKLSDSKQVAIRFARGSGYEFLPRGEDT